ncbi:hypothetical protein [Propionicimonas sp.]|uniref:hypothetical protein n=1 Tax=Propionicimonas sp. TaxID=1955623 RepID=UPI0039E2BDA7
MVVIRTRELAGIGQTQEMRARLERSGELFRVRHGAFADEAPTEMAERHLLLVLGTAPVLAPGTVLSHASAGVVHGLPSWEAMLGRVTVLRRTPGHGSRRRNLHVRCTPVVDSEVTQVDGLTVTTIERTAADLACLLPYERAVVVMDAALHAGADSGVLERTVVEGRGRHGISTARAALAFADGRSESVGESLSRVRLAAAGLVRPQLQLNVFDEEGNWLARTDFGWEQQGVLGEFDGRIKYVGTAEEVAQAVMQEKRREARLREAGWVVVRWTWADLADPAALRRRIESAFRQARPELIRGHLEVV